MIVKITGKILVPVGLRKCSPGFGQLHYSSIPRDLIVEHVRADGEGYAHECGGGASGSFSAKDVGLTLDDATGRAHAAWWVAERCQPVIEWLDLHNALGLWERPTWNDDDRQVFWVALQAFLYGIGVFDLDMDDPRTLPDGSRWVDAEALRIVCLHMAGLA